MGSRTDVTKKFGRFQTRLVTKKFIESITKYIVLV